MARVFLSYARADADLAKQIAHALGTAGHEVWWDREIRGGSRFATEIEQELRNADAVVVLWSKASIESAWVQDEAAEGRDSARLVPIALGDVRPPLGFRQYHAIPLADSPGQPGPEQFQALAQAIEKVAGDRARTAPSQSTQVVPNDDHSICVLPFENMSSDPDQSYFSDGITEDIITDLSKVSALSVVGRHTAFSYAARQSDAKEVARGLGVSHVLEGSVRKAGNQVRISARLVDGSTGKPVWAERYDRDLTDIFHLQDEISRAIVSALTVRLRPAEQRAIERRSTVNVEAYDYFLKGRQFRRNKTRNYLMLAGRMFAKAVEIDPSYARAYAGIASCETQLNDWYAAGMATDEVLAFADKALAIEPDLAEAHAARAAALADAERDAEAEAAFKRALELDADGYDTIFSYARFCMSRGRSELAADLFVRAAEIEPDDYQAPLLAELALRKLKRFDEAEHYCRTGLKLAEDALRLHPESSRPAQLGAASLAALGETERAKDWLAHALAIDPDDNGARYNAACCLAQIGEFEQALDLLEIWASHRGSEGRRWLLNDPDFDPLRDHPRYQAILGMMT